MAKIKCPKSNKETVKQRALTIEEQRRFVSALDNNVKYKEQFLLMLNTGMRMGEINALRPNDVNLNFKTITVSRSITKDKNDISIVGKDTKTEAGMRNIPLTTASMDILSGVLRNYTPNPENLLFTEQGVPISTNRVNMEFQRICKKYNVIDENVRGKVSLHSLRHTYATCCIESGMSAKVLQTLLGHTDIKITMNTYCDAFEEFKTEDIRKVEEYLNQVFA